MNRKTILKIAALSTLAILFFFSVNYVCHRILPKWIDVIVGYPLSFWLIFRGTLLYTKYFEDKTPI
jgi:hypothetical protein